MTSIPTWRYLVKMARARPKIYLLHAGLWAVVHTMPLIFGLIVLAFFDTLTGNAPARFGTSDLILLLIAVSLTRAALFITAGIVETVMRFLMNGLLRRNLLIYGVGGIVLPFVAIKAIDLLLVGLHLV